MNRDSARLFLNTHVEVPVARMLDRLGFTPNAVTVLGLVIAGGGAYLVSTGYLWPGGVVMLVAGVFDMFDGALARLTGKASNAGALMDSVFDRLSEAAFLLGLLVLFINRSRDEGIILVYLALVGSIMVSYLRARAEGLGIECKVGIMTRTERVVILGIALILGHWWLNMVLAALAAIAGLTLYTAAHRLIHATRTFDSRQ